MDARMLGNRLRIFGLGLPGAFEDHPWGELVLKVRGKVFAFLGRPGEVLSLSLKLPHSGEALLDRDCAAPTGYGLGKSGWVTLTVTEPGAPDEDELRAWIEESYRAVAPRTLVAVLDGGVAPEETPPAPARSRTRSTPAKRKAAGRKAAAPRARKLKRRS